MKYLIIAAMLLPCAAWAQVTTKITYNIPQGFSSGVAFYTTESDEPVSQGQAVAGQNEITIQTNGPATGFMYVTATKQCFPVTLNGTQTDVTQNIHLPGDESFGSSPDVFNGILQKFLTLTNSLKALSYVPDEAKDPAAAREDVKAYYRYLQSLIYFADSVVTKYPNDNASLFTISRLAHWCSYSPEVFMVLNKLDKSLLKSDFAKDLLAKRQAIIADSSATTGKKPGLGLQIVLNGSKLLASGASHKLLVFWDNNSRLDNDLIDDIKRLHVLYGDKALQVNFVYTGTTKNWEPMIKQAGMPTFANYVHCNKADAAGSTPVVTAGDNTCLSSGVRGYYLYRKVSQM